MFPKKRVRKALVDVLHEAYKSHKFLASIGRNDYTYYRGKEDVLYDLACRLGYTDEEVDAMVEEAKEPKREDEVQT